jgi:hypothetical protein
VKTQIWNKIPNCWYIHLEKQVKFHQRAWHDIDKFLTKDIRWCIFIFHFILHWLDTRFYTFARIKKFTINTTWQTLGMLIFFLTHCVSIFYILQNGWNISLNCHWHVAKMNMMHGILHNWSNIRIKRHFVTNNFHLHLPNQQVWRENLKYHFLIS